MDSLVKTDPIINNTNKVVHHSSAATTNISIINRMATIMIGTNTMTIKVAEEISKDSTTIATSIKTKTIKI
jgi:hypothetical protein